MYLSIHARNSCGKVLDSNNEETIYIYLSSNHKAYTYVTYLPTTYLFLPPPSSPPKHTDPFLTNSLNHSPSPPSHQTLPSSRSKPHRKTHSHRTKQKEAQDGGTVRVMKSRRVPSSNLMYSPEIERETVDESEDGQDGEGPC